MTDPPSSSSEMASLRQQLEDATATAAAQKKQLADAKAKAKAIIQRNMHEAAAKLSAAEEQNKLQADELEKVKAMLRDMDVERSESSATCQALTSQLEQSQSQIGDLQVRCSSLENEATEARSAVHHITSQFHEKETKMLQQLDDLRAQLDARNVLPDDEGEKGTDSGVPTNAPTSEQLLNELKNAKDLAESRHLRCEELQEENKSLREASAKSDMVSTNDNVRHVETTLEETRIQEARLQDLSTGLEQEKKAHRKAKEEHEKTLGDLGLEKATLQKDLDAAKVRVIELTEALHKSEFALQEEREKVIQNGNNKPESTSSELKEKNNILEAKVSEMERLVASKASEITKVREKAKAYLRELNAEKRAMEAKMKEEAGVLKQKLEEEQKKVEGSERRAENATKEIDHCLVLIRDKQKSVQMLNMTISTLKGAAQQAEKERESLQKTFIKYKDRTRQTLQEKQLAVDSVDATVDDATESLRGELDSAKKQYGILKSRLRQFENTEAKEKAAEERAERAEAAVELFRKNAAGASAMDYTRVDQLEEKVAQLETELASENSMREDTEAMLETTKIRLEAAERALRAAEVRGEEGARLSQKTIDGLRSQIKTLEKGLWKAQQSSAAAQRTAAAAAKAIALSSSGDEIQPSPTNQDNTKSDHTGRFDQSERASLRSPRGRDGGGASLAAAMERHSGSLGYGSTFDSRIGSPAPTESQLLLKDEQINVLTSQVAEFGALLEDVQREAELRTEQTSVLKTEVKNLDAKLAAAEKLQNGAPFSYLRTIVVRYLETDDATLLPVIANVLSFSQEESSRIRSLRGSNPAQAVSPKKGYFGLPLNGFLGSR